MLRDVRIAASRNPKLRPDGRESDDVTMCLLEGACGSAGSKCDPLDCGSVEESISAAVRPHQTKLNVPRMLTSNAFHHASGSFSSSTEGKTRSIILQGRGKSSPFSRFPRTDIEPAFAISTSSLPKRSSTLCTAASAAFASRTSAASASTSAPGAAEAIKSVVLVRDSSVRATSAIEAPALAYCMAVSCPIPRDAPVTSTTLPLYDCDANNGAGSMAG